MDGTRARAACVRTFPRVAAQFGRALCAYEPAPSVPTSSRRACFRAALFMLACGTTCPKLAMATTYRLTDLGDLSGGFGYSHASAINASGEVVGYSFGGELPGPRAFLWADGAMIDLGVLPGGVDFSYAVDINDAGQVIGHSSSAAGTRAFLWQAGSMVDLGVLPAFSESSQAMGINNPGQVIGESSNGLSSRIFRWEGGSMAALDELGDPTCFFRRTLTMRARSQAIGSSSRCDVRTCGAMAC